MKNEFQKAKYVEIMFCKHINFAKLNMEKMFPRFSKNSFIKNQCKYHAYMSTFAMGSECRNMEGVEINLFQF